jgi:hypothetical protein
MRWLRTEQYGKTWEKVEAEFEILADRALRGSAHSRNRRLTVPGRCLALPRPLTR